MTPEQLKQSEIEYEAMIPHDLRDVLSEAIWRVIQSGRGRVSVRFTFTDSNGETILTQEYFVNSNFDKGMLFKFLALVRGELEGMEYEFSYEVEEYK